MTPIKASLHAAIIVAGAMLPAAAPAQTLTTLYTFQGGAKDGANPASLIYQSGKLYGTTTYPNTKSVVFELSMSSGKEKVLAKFGQDSVGYYIQPNTLAFYNGLLYGTTPLGGNAGCSPSTCGTVFTVDPASSMLTVLYDFVTGGDAAHPDTALILANGSFYGLTAFGGQYGAGAVYSISPTKGAESVVTAFGGPYSPHFPGNKLIYANGLLYAVAGSGGNSGCYKKQGCGAIVSIDPTTGTKTTVYTFPGGAKGEYPGYLTYAGGKLYGTSGGTGTNANGLVFEITLSTGKYKELFAFPGGAGGTGPTAPLIYQGGTLYGITAYGGDTSDCPGFNAGCGIIYELTSGDNPTPVKKVYTETVLYTFTNSTDGSTPAALIAQGGTFHGVATNGGSTGYGTVFSFTP
jgi:uncharacterized repeat protein (TIGR03803 family)